jgi:uncharacterized membrane protein YqaE (UPF0057 family)
MRYIAAFLLPPLAVAMCGRTLASLVNLVVYILAWLLLVLGIGFIFYIIAAIHACLVVSQFYADRRAEELQKVILAAQAGAVSAVSTALAPAPTPPAPPAAPLPECYDAQRDTWRID